MSRRQLRRIHADHRPAVGAYRDLLQPPISNADVTYWLNSLSEERRTTSRPRTAAINTAVEATTVNERTFRLRSQDKFLRDNIQENDILVVSVGGNDVAMSPTPCTALSILALTLCIPTICLENGCARCSLPVSSLDVASNKVLRTNHYIFPPLDTSIRLTIAVVDVELQCYPVLVHALHLWVT